MFSTHFTPSRTKFYNSITIRFLNIVHHPVLCILNILNNELSPLNTEPCPRGLA